MELGIYQEDSCFTPKYFTVQIELEFICVEELRTMWACWEIKIPLCLATVTLEQLLEDLWRKLHSYFSHLRWISSTKHSPSAIDQNDWCFYDQSRLIVHHYYTQGYTATLFLCRWISAEDCEQWRQNLQVLVPQMTWFDLCCTQNTLMTN